MNADAFVDTNVLLYTIDEDPASALKRACAQQLLLSTRWGWSVQVAAEFFANATSAKRSFRLSAIDASTLVEAWFAFPTIELTPTCVAFAFDDGSELVLLRRIVRDHKRGVRSRGTH